MEGIDFAPTTLAIAGVPLPPKMQGRPIFGEPKQYVFWGRDRCDETVTLSITYLKNLSSAYGTR
ncbi:MAG: hypothetical protein WCP12_11950 [bacterium]